MTPWAGDRHVVSCKQWNLANRPDWHLENHVLIRSYDCEHRMCNKYVAQWMIKASFKFVLKMQLSGGKPIAQSSNEHHFWLFRWSQNSTQNTFTFCLFANCALFYEKSAPARRGFLHPTISISPLANCVTDILKANCYGDQGTFQLWFHSSSRRGV